MIRKTILIIVFISLALTGQAKEGMWLPVLLDKFNIGDMQQMGFKLTAEDVYSINHASMKDAVVIFGGGCTGEIISPEGLLITNHHCGFSAIQKHSSVSHDYLTEGFWAMSRQEELPNENLSVTFLKRMDDVTEAVLEGVNSELPMVKRDEIIARNIKSVVDKALKDNGYSAHVEKFYAGNQYYLFVEEVFTDVRLVGAPPSAIGKFGGDTDNWMWPRHTGDFSIFRVYAGKDNKPAGYAPDNVPFKPAYHFPISLKGVNEGDFTMVFGYPGSTAEYVPSFHLQMLINDVYPKLINVRTQKLNIIKHYMESDPAIRIQYAAKAASISNSWKRWKGEIKGLNKLDAVTRKQQSEAEFTKWVLSDDTRKRKWGNLLDEYRTTYSKYGEYSLARSYLLELIGRNSMETVALAGLYAGLVDLVERNGVDDAKVQSLVTALRKRTDSHFKDFYQPVDQKLSPVLLNSYRTEVPIVFHPAVYTEIDKKYKGDTEKFVDQLFQKTVFTNHEELMDYLMNLQKLKKLKKDPAVKLYQSISQMYHDKVMVGYRLYHDRLDSLNQIYMQALMAYEPERHFYPDANFTLRIAYGDVKGYEARDAVYYNYFSTLEGIMEKDNPDIYDYRVPERLKELYRTKDYGRYEQDGTVPVCFLATNHTTGGNSGSPVVNASGQLIGVNFDRAWEGVMSDLMFNPNQCRNISLDIRYALFIIDKFAGAGYLLDEMTLVE
ncbi:S46 family peptidase [Geofilum sp. OHC36d9]|uniref:S46 family peptidase n=1 Tax=Geofilum sp. OHC36d9 TaxID=3458413 RepID=UPI004033C93F